MWKLISAIVIIIHSIETSTGDVISMKLINDITLQSENGQSVVLKTNWTQNGKMEFVKSMPNRSVKFPRENNFTLDWNHANQLIFVIDLDYTDGKLFTLNVSPQLFKHPFRWILFTSNYSDLLMILSRIYLLPDTNIITALKQNDMFILQQAYRIEPATDIIIEDYGNWTVDNGLQFSRQSRIISQRRKNLKMKNFNIPVVFTNENSIHRIGDLKYRNIDPLSKVNVICVITMFESLNSTWKIDEFPYWGFINGTGKSGGIVGNVINEDGDISGTTAFITNERIPYVDYLALTVATRANFVFRAPPLTYVSNIYLLPFQANVWSGSFILVILSIVIILITYKLVQNKVAKQELDKANFTDVILIGVGAITQLGYSKEPRINSGRIAVFFLLLAMVFLYTSYTANIVALLQSTAKNIRTIEDLLNSKIELGAEDISYNRIYFAYYQDPIRKAIYEKKIIPRGEKEHFYNMSYGITRMRQGFFAFHTEPLRGYQTVEETFYEHEKCDIQEITFLQEFDPWLFVKKRSPYKEIIKNNLFKLKEHGLQKRINYQFYTPKPKCSGTGQNFMSVRLEDCYFTFVLLGYGFLLGVIMFLLEKLHAVRIAHRH